MCVQKQLGGLAISGAILGLFAVESLLVNLSRVRMYTNTVTLNALLALLLKVLEDIPHDGRLKKQWNRSRNRHGFRMYQNKDVYAITKFIITEGALLRLVNFCGDERGSETKICAVEKACDILHNLRNTTGP